MTSDNIERMAVEAGGFIPEWRGIWELSGDALQRFAALVAAAEQKPISDVTEAVTKTVIDVEKLLCEKIGRQWQPSGMSIQTLVDELAALVAAAEREACAKVCEEQIKSYMSKQYTTDPLGGFRERFAAGQCAAAIRARGEA